MDIQNWGPNPLYEPSLVDVARERGQNLSVRDGVIVPKAKVFALAAKAGAASRVPRAKIRLATTGSIRLLKQEAATVARFDLKLWIAQRELAKECRRLFRVSRQDYGVYIDGHVTRIEACLDRLCALRGDNSEEARIALIRGVVARALKGKDMGQVMSTDRGLGEHKTLTSAEVAFRRGQLMDPKLPPDVHERIARSPQSPTKKDSPMLRLIRESRWMHLAERAYALPSNELKALNERQQQDNDELIRAARQRKAAGNSQG